MTERVYCAYFDHNYVSRGLALYHSLQRHEPGARLWVLCLSDACYRILDTLDLPNIFPVRLEEFEATDPEFAATRHKRSVIEYYFTCTPAWILFVLRREANAQWITYLDGDLYFFGSPNAIYDELHDAAVAIVPHRFSPNLVRLYKFGSYNVGWVGVRNEPDGILVIRWWREKCIEWCHDYVDGKRFADQGYLDFFIERFQRVKVIENIGANLAPWNIGNYEISFGDDVLIDVTHPLIFFHFHGLKKAMRWFIFNSHRRHGAPFSSTVRNHIYRPYVDELLSVEEAVDPLLKISVMKPDRQATVVDVRQYFGSIVRNSRDRLFQLMDILTRRAFVIFRGTLY
jgi:hypothetical protein